MVTLGGLAACGVRGVTPPAPGRVVSRSWDAPGTDAAPGERVVALTFDDGPDPTWTPQVLAVLSRYGVPATFFDVGYEAVRRPDLVQAQIAAGHGVGAHTTTHADLTKASTSWSVEVDQNLAELGGIVGRPLECLRPPYGAHTAATVAALGERGLATIMWTSNPADYTRPGPEVIAARAIADASPGAVIGLHDGGGNRSQTVAALPIIIDWYRNAGYRFVSLCSVAHPPVVKDLAGNGTGGYVLDSAGGLAPFGDAPAVTGAAYWQNRDTARAVALNSANQGWVLSRTGRLHPFNGAPEVQSVDWWTRGDLARDVALRLDGVSGWVLDSAGGLHPFDGAPEVVSSAYWPGQDVARVLLVRGDGQSGYVVDKSGGVHSFGGAPELVGSGYWPNQDAVRGAVLLPSGDGGYVLDMFGAVWPFGSVPALPVSPPYFGTDVARGLSLRADAHGGWVVDAGGMVTPFGS
ncbi:MAG: polysaccharide deacetylase family protein [Acidimicrobiia bacterium]